jgi:heme A synthase
MTSTRSFQIAARLGLATTLLMSGLMVVGSVVRSTGSGMACPDWPLCGGHLIPPFEPHVLIEWFHRLLALLVSLLLFATVGWVVTRRALRARLGGLALLSVVLLAAQIVLGALTVWKVLSPAVVGSHLGVALLLFCTVLTLTLAARTEAGTARAGRDSAAPTPGGWLTSVTLLAAFGQCLLGGIVSATHAGTVCRDWPTCNGQLFPEIRGLVGIHMLHRYGAYALVALAVASALRGRHASDPRIRSHTRAALGLVLLQALLGIANVLAGTPPWLSATHLATAVSLVALLLVTTLRATALPARPPRLALLEAR